MKHRQRVLVLALAAFLANGCGTICNLSTRDPEVPFGGLQMDLGWLGAALDSSPSTASPPSDKSIDKSWVVLLPFEVALSAVGDVVTLPIALYRKRKAYGPRDKETAPPASDAPQPNSDSPPRAEDFPPPSTGP